MYQYDAFDQALVEQRSAEFRAQVNRRLAGEISEDEFKPIRLMNGLYLQLHAYMIRVAIPYGVMSSTQLLKLADIADKYDRGYGHFTTRQNIQFNWPKLVETPDLLDELASVQMHAIQTSGNCIRNITTDPFAGVSADESVDPRPLCELLRQWSSLHPEFAYLPRKFKFAITGSAVDRAAIKVHDIGLRLRKDSVGATLVDVWLGGGQGRTPKIAELFKEGLTIAELLPYLEATMRVYNRYGRRDNKYKARIKILLAETGLEPLQDLVEAEYLSMDKSAFESVTDELNRITNRFIAPDYSTQKDSGLSIPIGEVDITSAADKLQNPEFIRWKQATLRKHKIDDYNIVLISLKPHGEIPGDATSEQMRQVAALAKRFSHSEIRVTHRQNLILPSVHDDHLYALWKGLIDAALATSNVDMPSDIIACPGLDYCALATARSIPIAQAVSKKIKTTESVQAGQIGKLAVNVSGCINACAHHHVADIGILGLDRGGVENYQITLGGRSDQNARVGERMGPGVAADEVPKVVERVITLYLNRKNEGETFSDTYDRVGKESFKEVVYASDEYKATA